MDDTAACRTPLTEPLCYRMRGRWEPMAQPRITNMMSDGLFDAFCFYLDWLITCMTKDFNEQLEDWFQDYVGASLWHVKNGGFF